MDFQVRNIDVVRNQTCLIQGLSFEISSGNCLWLKGPNGSGKSSLIRALAGLLPLDSGSCYWDNKKIVLHEREHKKRIHFLGHALGFLENQSALDNFKWFNYLSSGKWQVENAFSEERFKEWQLQSVMHLPVKLLSEGQKQRLALLRFISVEKPIWLLDEPATALDTQGMQLLKQMMQNHLKKKGMIVMSSHQDLSLSTHAIDVSLCHPWKNT